MFDYKNFLAIKDFSDLNIEASFTKSSNEIEILGDKKDLLYLAARIIELAEDELDGEFNMYVGIDLTNGSSNLSFYKRK